MNRKKILFFASLVIFLSIIVSMIYSQVDNSLTDEDFIYIEKFLEEGNVQTIPSKRSFKEEINFISSVQSAVLSRAPKGEGIPFGTYREPKDIYKAKKGLCYDRSRVIEKILRSAGFKTRHISIYSTKTTGSKIKSLFTPGVSSHAVTEVLTDKGWLVVDSNNLWISLDYENNPASIEEIQSDIDKKQLLWNKRFFSSMNNIYKEPFTFLYGLYSRHGKMYPPFNPIPDIEYSEFLFNFF